MQEKCEIQEKREMQVGQQIVRLQTEMENLEKVIIGLEERLASVLSGLHIQKESSEPEKKEPSLCVLADMLREATRRIVACTGQLSLLTSRVEL